MFEYLKYFNSECNIAFLLFDLLPLALHNTNHVEGQFLIPLRLKDKRNTARGPCQLNIQEKNLPKKLLEKIFTASGKDLRTEKDAIPYFLPTEKKKEKRNRIGQLL